MAVGVSLKKDMYNAFKEKFEEIATEQDIKDIIPVIKIDGVINSKDINKETVKELEKLEPFGEKNKTPVFVYKNLKIDSIRSLTEGKHMKLTLKTENNNVITAMGFNMGNRAEEFLIGDKVDVVGMLEVNEFNGYQTIQFNLKDIMKSL